MLCAEKKKSINWRRKNEKKKQQQRGSNVEKWILCERNWKKGKKVMSPRRKVEKEKRKTLKQCGEKEMQVREIYIRISLIEGFTALTDDLEKRPY